MPTIQFPWRQQPPGATGPAPGGAWDMLWTGQNPTVNLASGQIVAAVAPQAMGTDGVWVDYQATTSEQVFAIPSTSTYTLVVVLAHPQSSTGSSGRIVHSGSAGIRVEAFTTGGGVYLNTFHTGVASGIGWVTGVSGFDSRPWAYVITYDGTTQRGWLRDPSATVVEASPATIGIGATTEFRFGYGGGASVGIYAAAMRRGALPRDVALSLALNPWQVFRPMERTRSLPLGAGGGGPPTPSLHPRRVFPASVLHF